MPNDHNGHRILELMDVGNRLNPPLEDTERLRKIEERRRRLKVEDEENGYNRFWCQNGL
jgi:hypothetical protein